MSDDKRLQQAVCNNAVWCDAVCRAHGKPGEFLPDLWLNRQATPRFYPNVVTLSSAARRDRQVAQIAALVASGLSGQWGVKDSFAVLDLSALGFQPVIEAEWIWRPATLPSSEPAIPNLHWVRVTDEATLARWDDAWNGAPPEQAAPPERIFLPPLLADPEIALLAAFQHERIVAGAIANRTGEVVGLSNLFLPETDHAHYWAGCVAAITQLFAGCAIVGYEGGNTLVESRNAGFTSLGELKIWIKRDDH